MKKKKIKKIKIKINKNKNKNKNPWSRIGLSPRLLPTPDMSGLHCSLNMDYNLTTFFVFRVPAFFLLGPHCVLLISINSAPKQ
jgi:hypothetical protein